MRRMILFLATRKESRSVLKVVWVFLERIPTFNNAGEIKYAVVSEAAFND